MIVQYIGNYNEICQLGRKLSDLREDEAFSANEIAQALGRSANELLNEISEHEQRDWVCRADNDWEIPATIDTRWLIREHHQLRVLQSYEVLTYETDFYRIFNEASDPVLYHKSLFQIVDPTIPEFWHQESGEDGECDRGPKQWMVPGYWERYHDGEAEVIVDFQKNLAKLYPLTWAKSLSANRLSDYQ